RRQLHRRDRTQPWSPVSVAVLLACLCGALVVVLLASLCVAVLLASHPASGIKYPPCYKDIGFWINESFTENNLCELVRGIAGDLVEETDTASVLLKVIGYIRFLQSQIEVIMFLQKLQRFTQPCKSDGSLHFLVVGDWGRRGEYNQSEVAYQLLHENCLKRKVPTSEQGSDKNNGAHNG
ncbi:hypothetical protein S245_004847, partial [Arachis hypogaea]